MKELLTSAQLVKAVEARRVVLFTRRSLQEMEMGERLVQRFAIQTLQMISIYGLFKLRRWLTTS